MSAHVVQQRFCARDFRGNVGDADTRVCNEPPRDRLSSADAALGGRTVSAHLTQNSPKSWAGRTSRPHPAPRTCLRAPPRPCPRAPHALPPRPVCASSPARGPCLSLGCPLHFVNQTFCWCCPWGRAASRKPPSPCLQQRAPLRTSPSPTCLLPALSAQQATPSFAVPCAGW